MDWFTKAAEALAKVEHLVASQAPQYQEVIAIVQAIHQALSHVVAGLTAPAPPGPAPSAGQPRSTDPHWPPAAAEGTEDHHG